MHLYDKVCDHSVETNVLGYEMKKVINFLVFATVVLTLFACVQVITGPVANKNQLAITSVRDMPIHYAVNSLFSLSPKYVKDTSLKAEQTQMIYRIYTDAIISDLKENGFTNTSTPKQAAFHVGFGIALANDLSDEKIIKKFGITPGLSEQKNSKKGSFLIYIEDVKTGARVWRGIAQGFAHKELSQEQRKKRATVVVSSVMQQFYQTN